MDAATLSYVLFCLVVVATPGPTVLLALSNGARYGVGVAGFGIAGAALSDVTLITAASLGMGAVLATSATVFGLVKMIGAGYLIWLGIHLLRSSGGVTDPGGLSGAVPNRKRVFAKSLGVAVTNPKGYLFFSAFLPQFMTPSEPILDQAIYLGALFVLCDVFVMGVYAVLGGNVLKWLGKQGAIWMDRCCGAVLVAMGIGLGFYRKAAG